ncbi:lipid A deacylase LpxR family protein [Dokdonia sp.]|uniref:lipid A deacylase LpxR family protein n=1 Tax=Dokdonia sp. TaxID=2024995 RepID=UPI003264C881
MGNVTYCMNVFIKRLPHYRSIILLCVFSLCSFSLLSQETYTQEISLQHDNDFIFAIDRYYTAGTFIGYSRLLKGDFLFKRGKDTPIQLDIRLGQETYTPRELFERNFDLLERPYAGYLFVSGQISKTEKTHLWSLQGEFGLAGPQSLAGDIQIAYHKFIDTFVPVWEGQIANSVHFNFKGSYAADIHLDKATLFKDLALVSTISLGTRLSYIEQEVRAFIGKRASISSSSAFNRIGSTHEFYGYAGVAYRYVINNALIEGNPLGDDSPFTLDALSSIGRLKSGIVYRGGRTTYSIEYNFSTKETAREGRLQYAAMIIKRSF